MLFGSFRYRRKASSEAGYLYLVLLLMVVFMVIGALALAPAITGQLKRDRENEMIHRGVQYSRAVKKYYKKFGAYPTTVDQLLNTNNMRFLRQKYKDPMTANGEWRLLHYGDVQLGANQLGTPGAGGTTGGVAGTSSSSFGQSSFGQSSGFGQSSFGQSSGFGQSSSGSGQSSFGQSGSNSSTTPPPGETANTAGNAPNAGATSGNSGSGTSGASGSTTSGNVQTTGSSSSSSGSSSFGSFGTSTTGAGSTFGGGGILGVASLSPKQSIHRFDDKDHYKDWRFIYDPTQDRGGLITGPYSTKPPLGFAGQGQVAQQGTQQPGSSFGGSSFGGSSSFGSGSSFGNSGGMQQQAPSGGTQNQMTPSMPPDTTPH